MLRKTSSKPVAWAKTISPSRVSTREGVRPLGILLGEGIGPEVIDAALRVLSATGRVVRERLEVRFGGPIGRDAEVLYGRALTTDTSDFCESVFAAGGAVLAGPGGGRFVYD